MDRSLALRSLLAFAAGGAALASSLTNAALAADAPVAKLPAPITIVTSDGKKGLVTAQTMNGKTSDYITLGGKAAAPGSYVLSDGKHVTVTGPNGLVDANSRAMLNPQPLPP